MSDQMIGARNDAGDPPLVLSSTGWVFFDGRKEALTRAFRLQAVYITACEALDESPPFRTADRANQWLHRVRTIERFRAEGTIDISGRRPAPLLERMLRDARVRAILTEVEAAIRATPAMASIIQRRYHEEPFGYAPFGVMGESDYTHVHSLVECLEAVKAHAEIAATLLNCGTLRVFDPVLVLTSWHRHLSRDDLGVALRAMTLARSPADIDFLELCIMAITPEIAASLDASIISTMMSHPRLSIRQRTLERLVPYAGAPAQLGHLR